GRPAGLDRQGAGPGRHPVPGRALPLRIAQPPPHQPHGVPAPRGAEGREVRRLAHRRPLRVHPRAAGRDQAASQPGAARQRREAAAAPREPAPPAAGLAMKPLERTVNPQDLDPQAIRLLPYPFAKAKGVLTARLVPGTGPDGTAALEVWIRPYPQASTL